MAEQWQEEFTGAGPVETITGIVNSGIEGDPVAIAGQTGALGLQALGFLANPVDTLASSAIGWLIEHFAVTNALLDVTTGDPAAVTDAADRFTAAAKQIDDLAVSHINALNSSLPTYFAAAAGTSTAPNTAVSAEQLSGSATAFHGAMTQRVSELRTASAACSGTASFITAAGILVGTVRGLIRDLLAELVWDSLKKAVATMAFAPLTGGLSAAGFLTERMMALARLLKNSADELSTLTRQLTDVSAKLTKIMDVLSGYLKSPLRQALATNLLAESGKGFNTLLDQDVPNRANETQVNPLPAPAHQPQVNPGPVHPPWQTSGTLDG